jgi:hypothetical protein
MRSLLNGIKSEFSALSGLEPDRVEEMVLNERIDLLVIICRSLNLNESVFERLVRFRVQHTGGVLPGMDGLLSQFRTCRLRPPSAWHAFSRFGRAHRADRQFGCQSASPHGSSHCGQCFIFAPGIALQPG